MGITREEYMKDSSNLFHDYYSQFVTEETKRFVLNSLTVESIQKAYNSGDVSLNEIKIPYNNMGSGGGWWWDDAPINLNLARELGEVSKNGRGSPSTRTCIGKTAARILANVKRG